MMNKIKNQLSLVIVGLIFTLPFVTTSCFKKGSEDPFISMYTRKARVKGDWEISSLKWEIRSDDGVDELLTTTEITGSYNWKRTIQVVGTDSIRKLEGKVLEGRNQISFYKDGRFTQTLEYEYNEDSIDAANEDITIVTTTKVQETLEGTWNFLNNVDDFKNKERLALVIQNSQTKTFIYRLTESDDDEGTPIPSLISTFASSQKYDNGEFSTIWTLRMLKRKQIIMEQNIERFDVVQDGEEGESYTEVGYKEQTLTRK